MRATRSSSGFRSAASRRNRSPHMVLVPLVVALCAGGAAGQNNEDKALALSLFAQGRELIAHGDYQSAATKFEGASNLLRTYGILINLAECYEKLGRTASAWSVWLEARSVAHAARKVEDEQRAAERLA